MITNFAKSGQFDLKEVAAQFAAAESLTFAARPFNSLAYRPVVLHYPGGTRAMLLKCVLESIGITPTDERLRSIFEKHGELGAPDYLENADAYDELGIFSIDKREAFSDLARLLGKPLKVVREYGDLGHMPHLFEVAADGQITEAAQ